VPPAEPSVLSAASSPTPGQSAGAPALRLRHCTKRYGDLTVIDGLDLDVPTGQRLAVIGPSGSGKTTLLRVIMTLDKLDSGTIEVFGDPMGYRRVGDGIVPDPRTVRRARARIGMVFQQFNLFPHMSALANIMEAPVRVLGRPKEQAREEALELLATVGLTDKANAYPRELSGGQQQRVAIARALAPHPEIMLFDEVTSALDPELVGEVLRVVRALARDSRMTMLIVTHEMNFARDVSDRVIFMERGRIVEDASPETLFTNPASERTRSFLRAIIDR